MSSKKPKRKREKKLPEEVQEESKPNSQTSEGDNNPFDFGGLPNRDLKKNLGCG